MSKYEAVLADWKSDVETIEHLDFDVATACEHPDEDGREAAWVCRFRCCGAAVLMCDEHHEIWARRVATGWGRGLVIFCCEWCAARVEDLAQVFDWFPIGGRP